ncbi:MAG TPA: hypothetical protein VGO50_02820 [Pyrinomonadaceae bacterium]|jgi:hypothetical protein|nr:hypothetical protein [Pyrinomonadaceae bacterium]
MNYLNTDHDEFTLDPLKKQESKKIVLEIALGASKTFKIQFDKEELEKDDNRNIFYQAFPELMEQENDSSGYSVCEGKLDEGKKQFVLKAFSSDAQIKTDLFFNYIKSLRLLAEDGSTILRSGDYGTFLLFHFMEDEKQNLHKIFSNKGIPFDAVEEVDIEVNKLYP